MEIKGDEFIKTVKLRQEKDDIQKRLEELDQLDNIPTQEEPSPYEEQIIQTESELDDIMLQAPNQNKQNNKKKYMVLGLLLVVLFLISLLAIRFLNNDEQKDDSTNISQDNISQDKVLDNDNIEQQYQKIINQKLNTIKEKNRQTEIEEKSSKEALDIKAIEKEEQKLPKIKEKRTSKIKKALEKDIFGMEETAKAQEIKQILRKPKSITKVVKKEVKKIIKDKKSLFANVKVKKETSKKISTKTKGIYIQIGSFSKTIDKKYIKNLDDNKIKYVLHKAIVKGTAYTKVLVGSLYKQSTSKKRYSQYKTKT